MKAIFAILSVLVLQSPAKEALAIRVPSLSRADSLPLLAKNLSALVQDTEQETLLRAYASSEARKVAPTEQEIRTQVAGMLAKPPTQRPVDLKITLLNEDKTTDFSRSILPAEGIIESVTRIGGTKITRTVLVDEETGAIVIHLLANKPGALSFRVSLAIDGVNPEKIENRKELSIPAGDKPGATGARVQVIPFESDVTPDGNSIIVRGEGEAMVLLTCGTTPENPGSAFNELGNRYDPGHNPPDPIKIWHGLVETKMKSVENSP